MPPPRDHDDELSTVVRSPVKAPVHVAPSFVVEVIEGPDAGARVVLDGTQASRVLVGTSPACDLRLTDREVSRRHAAFDVRGAELGLADLGSTNGTFANGIAVGDVRLRGGETVRMGATALRVTLAEAPHAVALPSGTGFGRLLGASVAMRRLYPLCERLAASDIPVLIEGETGTGKEVLAESLHEMGARARGPFLVFDCTAVPPNLIESELFGHERGAFTGALGQRKGIFEQAHGGTLLIDEIGELDPALQPKLLRAIQRSEIRRVGGDKWLKVDVRVLSATRRDLDREVQAGRFRDDLFFRLAVGRVELPPLRARAGDVSLLAQRFWTELGGQGALPYATLQRFEEYAWPGNVRELYNEIARQLALGDLAPPPSDDGAPPPATRAGEPADFLREVLEEDLPWPRARQKVLAELQRQYVERVLAQHGGNVARAAAASGIAHRYFQLLRARGKRA